MPRRRIPFSSTPLTRAALTLLMGFLACFFPSPIHAENDGGSLEEPLQGFIYLEAFETRKEFLLNADAIRNLAPENADAPLDDTRRGTLINAFRTLLDKGCKVSTDGEPIQFEPDRVDFVVMDPEMGPQPDTRNPIPQDEAILAAVFAAPANGFPKEIKIEWSLFPNQENPVPVLAEAMSAGTQRLMTTKTLSFTPENPSQTWIVPELEAAPELLEVPPPTLAKNSSSWPLAAGIALIGIVLAAVTRSSRVKDKTTFLTAAVLALLLAAGISYRAFNHQNLARLNDEESAALVETLLKNVYHALAFRDESTTFETLSKSLDGPILEELYLDIRRSLYLEEKGGPRTKVLKITLIDCVAQPTSDRDGIKARAAWTSIGSVSHWGHLHARRNQYLGDLVIEPIDDTWKITQVNLLKETRL
ncbi:MAG: hypothetical protein AAGD22_15455 [Verrucomicrobiota bacterium]